MPVIQFEGKSFDFPDDFTDEEISAELSRETSASSPGDAPSAAPNLTPPGQQTPNNDPFAGVGLSEDDAGITLTLPRAGAKEILTDPGAFIAESALKGITGLGRGLLTLPEDIIRGMASDEIPDEDLFKNPILGLTKTIGDIGRKIPRIKGGTTAGDVGGDILQFAVPSSVVAKGGKIFGKTIKGINDLVPGKGQALANLAGTSLVDAAVSDPTQDQSILESFGARGDLSPIGTRLGIAAEGAVIAPVIAGAQALKRFGSKVVRPLSKSGQEDEIADQLQKIVGGDDPSAISRTVQEIDTGLANKSVGPVAFQPTTADLTTSPELAGLQGGAVSKGDSVVAQRGLANRSASSREVSGVLQTGEPGNLKLFAEQESDKLTAVGVENVQKAEARLVNAEQEVEATLRQARGTPEGRASASEALTAELKDELIRKTLAKNAAFDAIDPKNSIEMDRGDVVDFLRSIRPGSRGASDEILKSSSVRKLASLLFDDVVDPITGETSRVARNPTFRELNDIRPGLGDEATKASRQGGSNLAGKLGEVKDFINDQAGVLAQQGNPQAVEALELFKNEFAPAFGSGQGRAFRQEGKQFKTEPTKVAGKFLKKSTSATSGARESAENLKTIIDGMPDRTKSNVAVREFITEDLGATLAGATRAQSVKRTQEFIKSNTENLRSFPEIRTQLDDFSTSLSTGVEKINVLADRVKSISKAVEDADKSFQRGSLGAIIKNDDPGQAVFKILGRADGRKAFDELRSATKGDAAAREGLKASLGDALSEKVLSRLQNDAGDLVTNKFVGALNSRNVLHALEKTYSKSELAVLDKIKKRLQKTDAINTTARRVLGDNLVVPAQRVSNLLASVYGIAKGRGLFTLSKLVAETLGGNPTEGMRKILARSLVDPEFAKMLLTKKFTDVEAERVFAYLANNVFTDLKESTLPDKKESK